MNKQLQGLDGAGLTSEVTTPPLGVAPSGSRSRRRAVASTDPDDPDDSVDSCEALTSDEIVPPPPLSASSLVPSALRNWDRYEVLELLGAGGMGAVYKARDPRLNRLVALKIIRPGLRHSSPDAITALVRRFLREARLQAALEHPHICKVFEIGELPSTDEEPGPPYIIMQLISGQPLHRAQAEMSTLDKVRVLQLVAEALHAAHRQGLIHRDIKPGEGAIVASRR